MALHIAVDTRLPPSLRQVVESTSFLLCAIVVLLYISPYSFAVVLLALLVSAVVLGQPHRYAYIQGSMILMCHSDISDVKNLTVNIILEKVGNMSNSFVSV